jgi:hypothetical protein
MKNKLDLVGFKLLIYEVSFQRKAGALPAINDVC